MKSLIVEDELTSRIVLNKILSPYGKVVMAKDGGEAMEAFTHASTIDAPFDLITLDIKMPVMDGHQVLEEIRKNEYNRGIHGRLGVKVIMTTASDAKNDVLKAFNAQCEAYLVKPVETTKLLDHIRSFGLI